MVAAAIKDGALDLLTKPLDYRKLKSILEATQKLNSRNRTTLIATSADGLQTAIGDEDPDTIIPSVDSWRQLAALHPWGESDTELGLRPSP